MATARRNLSLEEMDRQTVIHPMTPLRQYAHGELPARIIEGGEGVRVRDRAGRTYIDAFAGLYCVNIGYGRSEVAEAIAEQAGKLAYFHAYGGYSNEAAIRLADRVLGEWAPAHMSRIYFGLGGSDANETQVKIVWYYNNVLGRPGKKKIIARHRGYHGSSVMAGSLTGLPIFHRAFDLPVARVLHARAPYHFWEAEAGEGERAFAERCAAELDALIEAEGPDTVAAFIGEPVLGTGGIVPPPEGYWEAVQRVLRKHDVLLIADEVVCGFGRVGTKMGSDLYGMEPDLITVAKGLTSAYAPLSGAIVGEKIWRVLERGSDEFGAFAHGYTYSAHPIAAAAGLANLEILAREDLAGNARAVGAYLHERLRATFGGHPMVGEVRGVGLLAAIEFVPDRGKRARFDAALKVGPRIAAAALEEGLIARAMPHGDTLGFAPPLVITRDEVDEVVARTERAVDKVTDALAREGALASRGG